MKKFLKIFIFIIIFVILICSIYYFFLIHKYNSRKIYEANVNYNLNTNEVSNSEIQINDFNISLNDVSIEPSKRDSNEKSLIISFLMRDMNNLELYTSTYNFIMYDNSQNIIFYDIFPKEFKYYKLGFSKENFMSKHSYKDIFINNNSLSNGRN